MFPYSYPDAITHRKYYLIGFWVETTVYGVYVLLFLLAMKVLGMRESPKTSSSRFVCVISAAMFVLITIHNFANVYRMLQAFVISPLTDSSVTAPVMFLRDWFAWDCYMSSVILALLTWMADILVIYRCFLVYQKSYRVILVPCVLLLACIANTSITMHWFRHTDSLPWDSTMKYIVQLTYPLNVIQAVLTTGLIAHRIYSQHRQSLRAGIRNKDLVGTVSLMVILRIIVESAAIYTIQQVLLCILWALGNKAVIILQHAMVPTIGAVSSLMTVRMYIARAEAATIDTSSSWVRRTDDSASDSGELEPVRSGEVNQSRVSELRVLALPTWLTEGASGVQEEETVGFANSHGGSHEPTNLLDGRARRRVEQRASLDSGQLGF